MLTDKKLLLINLPSIKSSTNYLISNDDVTQRGYSTFTFLFFLLLLKAVLKASNTVLKYLIILPPLLLDM